MQRSYKGSAENYAALKAPSLDGKHSEYGAKE